MGSPDTNNFGVKGGPSVSVKPVNSVTGSVGDVAASSIARIANAPGVRGGMLPDNLNSKIPQD